MASARAIQNRIKSTRNIAQITKAMEAVSAVKMRKSQNVALMSRPYTLAALEILKNMSRGLSQEEANISPLLEARKVTKVCLVLTTSDKGLCGAFNSNVLRKASEFISVSEYPVDIVAIGKKSSDYCDKQNFSVINKFFGIGDSINITQTKEISDFLTNLYTSKQYDEVHIAYTNFISVLKQEVIIEKLLPFSADEIAKRIDEILPKRGKYAQIPAALGATSENSLTYTLEPSPKEVLEEVLPLLLETSVYHTVLEANASEHSARMVAMKGASDNASELIDELTLTYNKARQAQITKELTEISAGAAALEK